MIQVHMSKEYYDGCRDALYEYAVHRSGGLEVGSTGKTYKAAVAEVDKMQEESLACAIWRLMRDTHTASPLTPDTDEPPLWTGIGVDATRYNICLILGALMRRPTAETMAETYQQFVSIAKEQEHRCLGNRMIYDSDLGEYAVISSRSAMRQMMAQALRNFAEAFAYLEEFRCQKG